MDELVSRSSMCRNSIKFRQPTEVTKSLFSPRTGTLSIVEQIQAYNLVKLNGSSEVDRNRFGHLRTHKSLRLRRCPILEGRLENLLPDKFSFSRQDKLPISMELEASCRPQ
jgi:hypothetical protein